MKAYHEFIQHVELKKYLICIVVIFKIAFYLYHLVVFIGWSLVAIRGVFQR